MCKNAENGAIEKYHVIGDEKVAVGAHALKDILRKYKIKITIAGRKTNKKGEKKDETIMQKV